MKKLLYIVFLAALLLTGCEKNSPDPAPAALFQMDGDTTAAGISPGDGSRAFIEAYGEYTIQVAYRETGSGYLTMEIQRIPYDEPISTMIANFFINGSPITEDELCAENDVEPSELHALLSSTSYLRSHEVLYRYLVFDWEDSVITHISSDELNYNETFETPCVERST